MRNYLYFGDNLEVMRELQESSVDLCYMDPPFNSKRFYNLTFFQDGKPPVASVNAFRDTWKWTPKSQEEFEEIVKHGPNEVSKLLRALWDAYGPQDPRVAYLVFMTARLLEVRRLLKPTGSIYIHCDQHIGHYLKVIADSIFGARNFLNNIVWCYGLGGSSKRYWPRKHDDLLWYSRTPDGHFFEPDLVPATSRRMAGQLKKAPDYWDIPTINNMSKERLGYPTQKPEDLLERIVRSSCPEGGVVLDPFCGGGTTLVAAERLGRQWIGIDVTHLATSHTLSRLKTAFGDDLKPMELHGFPPDLAAATALAQQDRMEFQWWALSRVDAAPAPEERKAGSDKGIDGRIVFFDDNSGKAKEIVVSVKSGHVAVKDIRDLRGVMAREKATIGVLITLEPPTAPMVAEAAAAGTYEPEFFPDRKCPRIQILTIEDVLGGKRVLYYEAGSVTFRASQRKSQSNNVQEDLFDQAGG